MTVEPRISAPLRGSWRAGGMRPLGRLRPALRRHPWTAATVGSVLVAIVIVEVTDMRPEYDAYAWLVWGHQALHASLNTNSAPSWKPLPFLFTLPYALAGRTEVWLWMVTAVAAALIGAIVAGHLAHRLTGPSPARPWAPTVAGVFAGLGVLGIDRYWHFILISNSDPMIVTLCLAAADCHVRRRRRWAFALLVLAALGRPEVWPIVVFDAVWAWRAVPAMRALIICGLLVIPALSFGIPALTSHSWDSAGQSALHSVNALRSDKATGVAGRLLSLYGWPMRIALLVGIAFAVVRRDRRVLVLTGAGALWFLTEIVFAYHGWSAVPRYLLEAGAVLVVVAATGVGRLLAAGAGRRGLSAWVGPVLVVILVLAFVPELRDRARFIRGEVEYGRTFATQVDHLQDVISGDGGAARLRRCGEPVAPLQFQSVLAWELGTNVGGVGWQPDRLIASGRPIVDFDPRGLGWRVRPIHVRAGCDRLGTTTTSG